MIDLSKFVDKPDDTQLATVVDVVPGRGVKIKVEGDEKAIEMYCNSYVIVEHGDRVGIKKVSDTIIIEGKLQY